MVHRSPCFGQKTFGELYRAYSPALFKAIHKVLRNTPLTEDALQNTFIKIWLHRNQYDSLKGSPFTWMLNIARNEAIDMYNSKYYRQTKRTTPLYNPELKAAKDAFVHLDHIDVHKLLFILKPKDRVILELCFFRGHTCQQVAELLQLPCGTVKTRMQHSYKVLKAALK